MLKKSFYNRELITFSLIVLPICLVDALISIPTINTFLNPLSPKSDQHEISPYNIHTSENRVVMRIEYMIRADESN